MPLAKPNAGESKDAFIGRCMSNDTMESEFPDHEQRVGVCFSQWKRNLEEEKESYMEEREPEEIFKEGLETCLS